MKEGEPKFPFGGALVASIQRGLTPSVHLAKSKKLRTLSKCKGKKMSLDHVANQIKDAIENSPRNAYSAELHLQVIKHSSALQDITGVEFCDALGIAHSYGTEFSKMKKIAPRLKLAGLDVTKI